MYSGIMYTQYMFGDLIKFQFRGEVKWVLKAIVFGVEHQEIIPVVVFNLRWGRD